MINYFNELKKDNELLARGDLDLKLFNILKEVDLKEAKKSPAVYYVVELYGGKYKHRLRLNNYTFKQAMKAAKDLKAGGYFKGSKIGLLDSFKHLITKI